MEVSTIQIQFCWMLHNRVMATLMFNTCTLFFYLPLVVGVGNREKKTTFYLLLLHFCLAFLDFLVQISLFVMFNSNSQPL